MTNDRVEINMKKTGEKIKKLCAERGVTVKQIQDKLNIGASQSVYGWFSGKALPSLDNMYRLSKLLKVSMEDIIIDNTKIITVDLEQRFPKVPKYLFIYCNRLRETV